MKHLNLWKLLLSLSILAVFLVACRSNPPETEAPAASPTPAPTTAPTDVLEISQPIARWNAVAEQGNWVLVGYDDALNPTVVEPGTYVTVNFSATDDQVSGSGGCNNYFTTYTADDNHNLTINGPIGSTAMACEVGEVQESLFFSALETVSGYTVTDDGCLLLDYDSGAGYNQQLVFTPETSLVDTLWILTAYGDPNNLTFTEPGVVTSATFAEDGSVSGAAGCNQYSTSYTTDGSQISVEPMAITAMACETGMEQEAAFLQTLQAAETFRLGLQALELSAAGGSQVLQFTARHLPLENVRWNLVSIDGQAVPSEVSANALFTPATSPAAESPENTVNGSAGCNGFFGPYTIEGDSFTAGPFGITQMMCDEPVMEIEQSFLTGLASAESYVTALNQLTVTTESGSMVFTADRLPLEGPTWVLKSMGEMDNPRPPAEGTSFTAIFGRQAGMPSGVKAGETGCSDYTSAYAASSDEIKINLPQLSQDTCTDGQEEAEQGYFLSLNAAQDFRILGNELAIYYTGGVLNYEGSYPPPTPEVGPLAPLDGTQWWLTSIDTFVVIPGSEVTAIFNINPDGTTGTISGSGGCNEYNAGITGVFTLGPISASNAVCDTPEGIMEQEASYLSVLGNANGVFIEGDTLRITTNLETLNFSNQAPGTEPTPGPSPTAGPTPDQTPVPTGSPTPVPTETPTGAPTAVINAPSEAMMGDTITFDGSGSSSTAQITSYQWSFGDGTTAEGATVQHSYSAPGVFPVSLTVTDSNGLTGDTSAQITIYPTLVGPTWFLDGSGGTITLIFTETTVSGNGGCNDYDGTYSSTPITGTSGDLTITSLDATPLLCDEDVMIRELDYFIAFESTSAYTLNQFSLTLTTEEDPLTFTAQ